LGFCRELRATAILIEIAIRTILNHLPLAFLEVRHIPISVSSLSHPELMTLHVMYRKWAILGEIGEHERLLFNMANFLARWRLRLLYHEGLSFLPLSFFL